MERNVLNLNRRKCKTLFLYLCEVKKTKNLTIIIKRGKEIKQRRKKTQIQGCFAPAVGKNTNLKKQPVLC